jgi:hypothetical protein
VPKSTETAVRKNPMAVIMLASQIRSPDTVGDWDFEWFITPEGVEEFWKAITDWADQDVKDEQNAADLIHVIAEVTDTTTKPLTLGRVAVYAPEKDADGNAIVTDTWKKEREQYVRDNPDVLFAPSPKRAVTKKAPAAKAVKPPSKPQKGRKQNEAAKDLDVQPVVKGRAARKAAQQAKVRARKGAVSPSQVPDVLKGVTTQDVETTNGDPKDSATALRERLENKKADNLAEGMAAVLDGADPDEVADKMVAAAPMGFRVNILR